MFRHSILFLFICLTAAGKDIVFTGRFQPGEWMSAEIQLNYQSDFRLVIPGAADPVRRGRSARLVFFGSIRIDRMNERGLPVILTIHPVILSGTVNGKSLDSSALAGQEIRARIAGGKTVFTFADGNVITGKSEQALAFLFRREENITAADLLGKTLPDMKKDTMRYLSPEAVYGELRRRNIPVAGVKLISVLADAGKTSIGKIPCRSFRLALQTEEPKDADLRYQLKITVPEDSSRKNILKTEYKGVEVLTDELKASDPMASGAKTRLITSESVNMTLLPGTPQKKKKSSFFDSFR